MINGFRFLLLISFPPGPMGPGASPQASSRPASLVAGHQQLLYGLGGRAGVRRRLLALQHDFLFCGAPGAWPVRSLVSRVALPRGWRASALRLLYVVKLSVEVR
jgi:hypothetical protein